MNVDNYGPWSVNPFKTKAPRYVNISGYSAGIVCHEICFTQSAFTCSKSRVQTPKQCVTIKTSERR